MHLLARPANLIFPTGHDPLIQSKGLHNRLDRAPIRKKRDNLHNACRRRALPRKPRALLRTKHSLAGRAPRPSALARMNDRIIYLAKLALLPGTPGSGNIPGRYSSAIWISVYI